MLMSGVYSSPTAYPLGAFDVDKTVSTIANSVEKILPSIIQLRTYNAQLKLAKAQAKRNNALLDVEALQSSAPILGVEVSANPELTKYMLIGGAALLLIILMNKKA